MIVNPAAGGGRAGRQLGAVRAELSRLGLEHHVERTRSLEHARELAAAATAAGEAAVAFGGDGLVGAVAGVLAGSPGTLGVLPGGRGNDFARVLGIGGDPVSACAVLAGGQTRALDLGVATPLVVPEGGQDGGGADGHGPDGDGRRTFIGIASCGFDSEANRIANETRLVRGNLVYAYGAMRALAGWRPATFMVTLDGGERISHTGYSFAAANSAAFGGGMFLAPQASLQDGLLDVVLVGDTARLRYLRMLPTVFKGTHVQLPEVTVLRAQRVEVHADRPFTMYADGDPLCKLPVALTVAPGAVRTLVPESYASR